MTCEEVREQLTELALGTIDEQAEKKIREHLRGCASCRAEAAALLEGVGTVALAARSEDPPPELKDRVLGVLQTEWREAEEPTPITKRRNRAPWWIAAAAVVVMLASGGWAIHAQVEAQKYETFLGVLGGENVRVGSLQAAGGDSVHGSVVIYDSKNGQNWVLALVQAPGTDGEGFLTLSDGNRTIKLRPMTFSEGGEASSLLVTSANLRDFANFTLTAADGTTLATGTAS